MAIVGVLNMNLPFYEFSCYDGAEWSYGCKGISFGTTIIIVAHCIWLPEGYWYLLTANVRWIII